MPGRKARRLLAAAATVGCLVGPAAGLGAETGVAAPPAAGVVVPGTDAPGSGLDCVATQVRAEEGGWTWSLDCRPRAARLGPSPAPVRLAPVSPRLLRCVQARSRVWVDGRVQAGDGVEGFVELEIDPQGLAACQDVERRTVQPGLMAGDARW